jgi:hypothetical protein
MSCPPRRILVEIAPGELVDKLTILEIKSERITAPDMLHNVRYEMTVLDRVRQDALSPSPDLDALAAELKRVNVALWDIEDEIRRCELTQDFGPRFVALARAVYRTNDRRAQLKRAINELLGSEIIEEKQYVAYDADR